MSPVEHIDRQFGMGSSAVYSLTLFILANLQSVCFVRFNTIIVNKQTPKPSTQNLKFPFTWTLMLKSA